MQCRTHVKVSELVIKVSMEKSHDDTNDTIKSEVTWFHSLGGSWMIACESVAGVITSLRNATRVRCPGIPASASREPRCSGAVPGLVDKLPSICRIPVRNSVCMFLNDLMVSLTIIRRIKFEVFLEHIRPRTRLFFGSQAPSEPTISPARTDLYFFAQFTYKGRIFALLFTSGIFECRTSILERAYDVQDENISLQHKVGEKAISSNGLVFVSYAPSLISDLLQPCDDVVVSQGDGLQQNAESG